MKHNQLYIIFALSFVAFFSQKINSSNLKSAMFNWREGMMDQYITQSAEQSSRIDNGTQLITKNGAFKKKIDRLEKSLQPYKLYSGITIGSLVGCLFFPTSPFFFFTAMYGTFGIAIRGKETRDQMNQLRVAKNDYKRNQYDLVTVAKKIKLDDFYNHLPRSVRF